MRPQGDLPASPPPELPTDRQPGPERTPRLFGGWPWLASILRDEARWKRLLIALALSVTLVGFVLYYTRGALIYGADYYGIYTAGDFWVTPRPDYLIPSALALVFPTSPSAVLYASLALEAFVCSYCGQFLAREMFRRSFGGPRLLALGAIASGLYLFSPVAISYWYVGVVTNVFLSSAAFFAALGLLVILLKSFRGPRPFRWSDAAGLGVALGLSAPISIPNDIRVAVIAVVLILAVFAVGIVQTWGIPELRRRTRATIARVIALSTPIAALLFFYPFYTFFTAPGFNFQSVGTVATEYSVRYSGNTYDSLWFTIRLLGRSSFPHTVYYPGYTASLALTAASLAWPLLVFGGATVLALRWRIPDRWLVLAVVLFCVPGVFWEAGSNPPAGWIHDSIAGSVPYGNSLLQTYALTLILLSKLFPVIAAFTIVAVSSLLGEFVGRMASRRRSRAIDNSDSARPSPNPRRRPRPSMSQGVAAGSAIAMVAVLASSAWPIYSGQVEQTTWYPGAEGYHIPSSYFAVRSMVQSSGSGGLVVLPQIGNNFRTSWGFDGANGFFTNFFYPNPVLVPKFFGAYALYLNSTAAQYARATNPLGPDLNRTVALNVTFPPTNAHGTATSGGGLRAVFGSGRPINITGATWLRLHLPYTNAATVAAALGSGNLLVGLQSVNSSVSWYLAGQASNALIESTANQTLTIDLLVDAPSSGPLPNTSRLSTIQLLVRVPVASFGLFGPPFGLSLVRGSTISVAWVNLMRGLHMTYLLTDQSIVFGQSQPDALVNDTIDELSAVGLLEPRFSDPILSVYELNPRWIPGSDLP